MLCFGCKKKVGNQKCSACHSAIYCSTLCQKSHWKNGHNKECCAHAKQNIHAASFRGSVDILKRILAEHPTIGVNWANPMDGGTAAAVAAQGGHHECLTLLAARGADLAKMNKYGCSPVHAACRQGNLKCLEILLALGASPFSPTSGDESVAETPAKLCIVFGHVECLAVLYEYGVSPNDLNRHGQNHIHQAAISGVEKIIQFTYNRGGMINCRDARKHTPLDIAVAMDTARSSSATQSCVTLLRSLGGVETPRPAGQITKIISVFGNVLSSPQDTLVSYRGNVDVPPNPL